MIWIRRLKFYQYKSRNVCTLNQLRQRNLIAQATDSKKLESILTSSTCVYTGFDPTAQSLHVGNLLALISLLHFQITGHDVIALLGGATGSIGDPSGKSLERIALDESVLSQNSNSIQHQLTHLFNNFERYANKRGFQCTKPIFLDNSKWLSKISLIDFISTIGRKCRVSSMLARDSVKGRMEGDGISFTEFTYQLLQAYDFWHLFSNHGCKIQIGGSDQWGNITAGLELIRKLSVENHPGQHVLELAHGITIPLVTTSSGEKFGKSEGNAIWLDETMLSAFDFYQFFRKTPDDQVEKLLKYFTLLPIKEIEGIISEHQKSPKNQLAQKILSYEVTELVHGVQKARNATVKTSILYDKVSFKERRVEDILEAFRGDKGYFLVRKELFQEGRLIDFLVGHELVESKSMIRKIIKGGGFYCNEERIQEYNYRICNENFYEGRLMILRLGKEQYRVIELK